MNLALGVVGLALVVLLVVLLATGASGVGKATNQDARADKAYAAVTTAATAETLAFMTVDYRNMDPLMQKVVDGATGQFKKEYVQSEPQLKSAVEAQKSMSTGKVVSVGISSVDSDSAVVFVAADSQVTNSSTKGAAQPRYYRLQLDMSLIKGRWLVNKLQFVG